MVCAIINTIFSILFPDAVIDLNTMLSDGRGLAGRVVDKQNSHPKIPALYFTVMADDGMR
jgi:hypothetical protein